MISSHNLLCVVEHDRVPSAVAIPADVVGSGKVVPTERLVGASDHDGATRCTPCKVIVCLAMLVVPAELALASTSNKLDRA